MSSSAFAGSPLLISPELLLQEHLIVESSLHNHPDFSRYRTDFVAVADYKSRILKEAYGNYRGFASQAFLDFASESPWLEDYALFMTLNPKTLQPSHVAGVPPDYFSATGQRWGNPLYRWQSPDPVVREGLLDWWISRISAIFKMVDTARIDHFRGFDSYWSIPAENETAVAGQWLPGPGKPFFDKIFTRLGKLEIVAEDLGIITPAVGKLRDDLGFPGMKVLQFAFDGNPDNSFLPYNFDTPHCVVYTGTHDNDTTLGWFLGEHLDDCLRQRIKRLANR